MSCLAGPFETHRRYTAPAWRRATAAGRFAIIITIGVAGAAALAGDVAPVDAGFDDPEPLASDLSIAHMARQPASMVMCSYGYWAEKAGDHATAVAIFDRCIDAGYAGAMIWKALMHEDGSGVPQDSAKAAALLHRAASSGDSGYATLGKLHYATALHLGKGVARDEAEALKWFRAAAAEGDRDAQEFLRSGHHVGERDLQGRGVGTRAPHVQGSRLEKVASTSTPGASRWLELSLIASLAAMFAAGSIRQAWPSRPHRRPDPHPEGA